jgi:hypothetical protein
MSNETTKYRYALDIIKTTLGKTPVKHWEYEQHIVFFFNDEVSVRFYFDTTGKLEEIHTVDCKIQYPKVINREFRSVR